jgi:hypothetical protein
MNDFLNGADEDILTVSESVVVNRLLEDIKQLSSEYLTVSSEYLTVKSPLFDDFISKFSDVFDVIKPYDSLFVAGGAIRDYVKGIPPKDFDIFGEESEISKLVDVLRKESKFSIIKDTDRLLRGTYKTDKGSYLLDIVKNVGGSQTDVLDAFDFTVSKCAINKSKQVYHVDYYMDLASMRLSIGRKPNPSIYSLVGCLQRIQKYINKGFRLCPNTAKNILLAARLLPNAESLENAYIYVD